MKRFFKLVITLLLLLFCITGCSTRNKVTTNNPIPTFNPSDKRVIELIDANNITLNILHDKNASFSIDKFYQHIKDTYAKDTYEYYFNNEIFYMKSNKINTSMVLNKNFNLASMQYSVDFNNFSINNNNYIYEVTFKNDNENYIKYFEITYSEDHDNWVLLDIVI